MILQALVEYYEALERKGKITSPGWCRARVAYGLDISEQGELKSVIPLKQERQKGKKTVTVPQNLTVPQMVSRSSGVSANFLCDHSGYMLGIDNKGKPERSRECFECAKKKHKDILGNISSPAARAVCRFFDCWAPDRAAENPYLVPELEEIISGSNLVFMMDGEYVHEDPDIMQCWEEYSRQSGTGPVGVCLVTGRREEIARIHGTIKGVQGAQSSGAALVSFNAPAFESYGKEQSFNAPVGTYAAYAYTTALNYLLGDRTHGTTIGDTAVVYWSEEGDERYQNIFACVSEPTMENQEIVDGVFKNLAEGKAVAAQDVQDSLDMDRKFYILGLAPNAARLAVRFFYQDSFGNILKHIKEHYDRMEIVRPAADAVEYLGMWRMLQETVNKKSRDKKPVPNMAGAVYRAIISGDRYPDSLFQFPVCPGQCTGQLYPAAGIRRPCIRPCLAGYGQSRTTGTAGFIR